MPASENVLADPKVRISGLALGVSICSAFFSWRSGRNAARALGRVRPPVPSRCDDHTASRRPVPRNRLTSSRVAAGMDLRFTSVQCRRYVNMTGRNAETRHRRHTCPQRTREGGDMTEIPVAARAHQQILRTSTSQLIASRSVPVHALFSPACFRANPRYPNCTNRSASLPEAGADRVRSRRSDPQSATSEDNRAS